MRIKRDYSQPFFRQPKRHPIRNILFAVFLGLLLGLGVLWQWDLVEPALQSLGREAPTPTPSASELATRAAERLLAGDLTDAEALLARAVEQVPSNFSYLYEHGRVLIDLGRYDEAHAIGETISDLDPRDARGIALKASALTWQGQPSSAIPIALSGLERNPRFTLLHATLTRAYVDAERWAEALEAGERGLSISTSDSDLLRAYAYALQSVGSYDEAARYLQSAIELRPSFLPTHFELAGLHLARDEDQSAIDLYDRILSLDQRNARAMLRLCLAYRKVGEFARALGFCKDSVDNDPSDPEAQFQLAMLYYRERQFEASRAAFQRCLDYDDGFYDLSCRYRLGLSRYYTGDCTGGWTLLRDSLTLAQAAADAGTISNILQGLEAIEADPQCVEAAAAPVSVQD